MQSILLDYNHAIEHPGWANPKPGHNIMLLSLSMSAYALLMSIELSVSYAPVMNDTLTVILKYLT